MPPSLGGFYLPPKDMNGKTPIQIFLDGDSILQQSHLFHTNYYSFNHAGLCQLDTGSEADMEAAMDPLLCHYQGPMGSLLRRDNMYSTDPSEVFTGVCGF